MDWIPYVGYHSMFSGSAKIICILKYQNFRKLRSFLAEFLKKIVYWSWNLFIGTFYVSDSVVLRWIALFCCKVFNFFLFWFCVCNNLKNKLYFLVHDDMPMVSVILLAREVLGSRSQTYVVNISDEEHVNILNINKLFLKIQIYIFGMEINFLK